MFVLALVSILVTLARMNKKDRLIYITEQKMQGYHIVFDDRWDHDISVMALGEDRREFDTWARAKLESLKSHYKPLPGLVLQFLFNHQPWGKPDAAWLAKTTARQLLGNELRDALYIGSVARRDLRTKKKPVSDKVETTKTQQDQRHETTSLLDRCLNKDPILNHIPPMVTQACGDDPHVGIANSLPEGPKGAVVSSPVERTKIDLSLAFL